MMIKENKIMKQIKLLAIGVLFLLPLPNHAQSISSQLLLDSITALKAEISNLQKEVSLPPTKIVSLDKANNQFKIIESFYYENDLVIIAQVSGNRRSNINIDFPVKAYVNGYHYESLPLMTDDVVFTLKPDIPRNVKFIMTLQNYNDRPNHLANRIIDYFCLKEKNSDSLLEFYSIPIRYDE